MTKTYEFRDVEAAYAAVKILRSYYTRRFQHPDLGKYMSSFSIRNKTVQVD